MSDGLTDDIKKDFVNELKDYIPLLRDKADKLNRLSPEASDTNLTELHRLVHAIRGASALIKLNNLSEVASELETIIEAIISDRLDFDATVFSAITNTIDYFDDYAKAVPCDDAISPVSRADILAKLRDISSLASTDDGQDMLSQLLKAADQNEDNSHLVFNANDLSFDDIDGQHDHLALTEDELADVVGHIPKKETQSNADTIPIDFEMPSPQSGASVESESIDLPQAELLEGFYQESEDHFQDLGSVISELEDRIKTTTAIKAQDKERLRLIRRSVHTVKGAAAVVKLKPIASWGHEFENVLDWLYEKASVLSPDAIKVIANATDIFENLVTDPEKVDPQHMEMLRLEFKRLIASGTDDGEQPCQTSIDMTSSKPADVIEMLLPPEENQGVPLKSVERKIDMDTPTLPPDIVKTMRVDLAKVKSLANIGGELTIALSAFDQDMDDLGSMIGEIDRTHFRLKNTARDLELGYEGKAIGKVDIAGPISENMDGTTDGGAEKFSEFDLLELDRYSELSLIIRSLSETAADAGTISQQLSRIHSGFKGYLHHLHILLSELNEKTMRMRMTPMSAISNRMRRTVRETASQLNKKVRLTLEGEHIELDKLVWDKLADPLMHLLRNAVDHGVESKTARRNAGKPETSDIRIQAAHQGNQVVLRISDDGPGIDYDAIRSATIAPDTVDNESDITQEELTDMIFQPGFSTRRTISEVSGRGMGLDVVKENIHELKGNVTVEKSDKDAGTTFLIKLPLTMAVIKALIFDIRGRRYATALYDIKEILRVNPKDLTPQGDKTIYVGGRRLPYYNLSGILGESAPDHQSPDLTQWPLLLIIEKETWQGAVAIDRMYSQRDIVIKNLGNHLGQVKGIAGATVMGDGKVVPILNFEELIRTEIDRPARPLRLKPKTKIQKPLEIMVVDDSVTIRNVVSRLMKRQGWKVLTAKDGVEAIEILYTRKPDVIILDIEMPRMNGYEFMSSIRAQEEFNDLPVIMHTSRASKKHRKKAKSLGVNGFVTKPYEEEYFITLVKELGGKNTGDRKDSELPSDCPSG